MKIRIKDNSVRFRLTQSEVRDLGEHGIITSFTEFTDRPFIYVVEKTNGDTLTSSFVENRIVLQMPETMIQEFVNTDRVGFEGETGVVKLLIEKDFVCLDNSTEDQSDNFPNPNMTC